MGNYVLLHRSAILNDVLEDVFDCCKGFQVACPNDKFSIVVTLLQLERK